MSRIVWIILFIISTVMVLFLARTQNNLLLISSDHAREQVTVKENSESGGENLASGLSMPYNPTPQDTAGVNLGPQSPPTYPINIPQQLPPATVGNTPANMELSPQMGPPASPSINQPMQNSAQDMPPIPMPPILPLAQAQNQLLPEQTSLPPGAISIVSPGNTMVNTPAVVTVATDKTQIAPPMVTPSVAPSVTPSVAPPIIAPPIIASPIISPPTVVTTAAVTGPNSERVNSENINPVMSHSVVNFAMVTPTIINTTGTHTNPYSSPHHPYSKAQVTEHLTALQQFTRSLKILPLSTTNAENATNAENDTVMDETNLIDLWQFSLKDPSNNTINGTQFAGKPAIVYFGYSLCPEICPTALQAIQQASKDLDISKIFITIDPARDDAAQLKNFMATYPGFMVLHGSESETSAVCEKFKVFSGVKDQAGLINHSSLIYLLNTAGHIREIFEHNCSPIDLRIALKKLL